MGTRGPADGTTREAKVRKERRGEERCVRRRGPSVWRSGRAALRGGVRRGFAPAVDWPADWPIGPNNSKDTTGAHTACMHVCILLAIS